MMQPVPHTECRDDATCPAHVPVPHMECRECRDDIMIELYNLSRTCNVGMI